jgi:hypothetical protein
VYLHLRTIRGDHIDSAEDGRLHRVGEAGQLEQQGDVARAGQHGEGQVHMITLLRRRAPGQRPAPSARPRGRARTVRRADCFPQTQSGPQERETPCALTRIGDRIGQDHAVGANCHATRRRLFLGFQIVIAVVSLLLGPLGLPSWVPIVVVVGGLVLIARSQQRSP